MTLDELFTPDSGSATMTLAELFGDEPPISPEPAVDEPRSLTGLSGQALVDAQVSNRVRDKRLEREAGERAEMQQLGMTPEQYTLHKRAQRDMYGDPLTRILNAPIFRGVLQGTQDLASTAIEGGLRVLPGGGAPEQLADELFQSRQEDAAYQQEIDKQQGVVAETVNDAARMGATFLPGAAIGVPAWAQVAASGATDAAGRSDDAAYIAKSAAGQGLLTYLGGKLGGAQADEMFTKILRSRGIGNFIRGYFVESGEELGQQYVQAQLDRAYGVGDGSNPTQRDILKTLALVGMTNSAAQVLMAEGDGRPDLGQRAGSAIYEQARTAAASERGQKVLDFIRRPSRSTAAEVGVEQIATTQKQRQELAAKVSNALTAQQFREQLAAVATSPEEASAIEALVAARAEAAGESLDDYVGKRIKAVEKASLKDTLESRGQTLADLPANEAGKRPTDRRGEIEFIEDGRAIIRAFESQDITTLTHEVGHLFRRDMQGDLLKRAEGWAGVKDGKWDRAAEEKFARGFERYLRTGRAPTARLKPVFEQFKGWLLGVYKAIRGTPLDVNFNRDIRQVFDELLIPVEAAQDAQVQAEVPAEVQPEELTDTLAEEPFDREKSVTSTKNAQEDQERIDRGLEPLMAPMRYSNQQAWDDAMKEMDADPDWQDRLISDVSQRPREMSAQENMALLHRKATLHNKYRRALELKEEADATGEEAEIAAAEAYINATAAELADFDEVVHKAGSFFGTGLQARKAFVDDEFNLVKMTTEARAAKGRDLTPEERAELERISTEAKDLNEQIAQRDGNKEQLEIDAGIKRAANDARKKPRQKVKLTPEQERDAAIAGIKQKAAKGETTDIKSFLDQLARYFYTQGITEREALVDAINGVVEPLIPNWSRDLTRRAWSGYGDFKPLTGDEIKRKLADLKGQVQQTLKLDALNKRVPLEKTGVERRTPSDEERRLIKQVNELKKKLGVVVTDPAKQLKGALDARKTYYRNRLVDLQAEIDSRQQNVKGSTPPPTDPELEALLAEYKIVKEAHEATFGKGGLTDEQRLQLAIKAAAKNEQYWNDRLARAQKGDFKSGRRKPQPPQNSYSLMRIKARTELVKQQFEELQDLANPKKTPQERALQAAKTRMKNEALRLTEKLANGDFSKRASTPVVLDEEGNKLKAKLDLVRQQYQQGLERDRWNKLSVWKKLGQRAMDAYDLSRMIMTTGEFSFLLRQGKFSAVSHPVKTARAMREAFRAMKNDETALAIEHGIYSHPKFAEASAAKLHITADDAKLSRQEELIMGRLTNKLPGIAAFARAGRVFMNKLRFDMYLAMEESLTRNGVATPEERVQIAKFINESTGRGGLGRVGEPAAVALGRVFFSPRYLASRLQMLSGHSMWGGSNRSRKLIAQEYSRIVLGMGMYYTALSWLLGDDDEPATVNLNPTSSDFGKVRRGNVRVDPLAGLSQVATFMARTVTNTTTTLQGETKSLNAAESDYGDDDWADVAARFQRSKLHPVVGAFVNWRSGATMTGEESTASGEIAKMSAPITWGDMYEALTEQGLSKGAATSLLAFFGEGVQVHKD